MPATPGSVPTSAELIDDWMQLATAWLNDASELAKRTTTKVQAGGYTAADVHNDVLGWWALVTMGWANLGGQMFATARHITSPVVVAQSQGIPAHFPKPLAVASALRLDGPFVHVLTGQEIAETKVGFSPVDLAAGQSDFRLQVDTSGALPGDYRATVVATPTTGRSAPKKLPVQITVV